MLNVVVLIGRLTKDPELRYTPSGKAVCTFRLAVDRGSKGQDGKNEVDFINIIAWERQAETVANYLQKGRLVSVQGRLQIRQWDQDGQRREKAEVVALQVRFLDKGEGGGTGGGGSKLPDTTGYESNFNDGDDDDVPF